jgi:hypothetical protein
MVVFGWCGIRKRDDDDDENRYAGVVSGEVDGGKGGWRTGVNCYYNFLFFVIADPHPLSVSIHFSTYREKI